MARRMGYKLTGKLKPCDACAIVTAKAKQVKRSTLTKTSRVGERVGLDISGPFSLTSGKYHQAIKHKLFWYSIADHYSTKTMNAFKYTKSELVDFVTEAYQFMNTRGTPIEMIRMDNADENEKVAKTY